MASRLLAKVRVNKKGGERNKDLHVQIANANIFVSFCANDVEFLCDYASSDASKFSNIINHLILLILFIIILLNNTAITN